MPMMCLEHIHFQQFACQHLYVIYFDIYVVINIIELIEKITVSFPFLTKYESVSVQNSSWGLWIGRVYHEVKELLGSCINED